MAAGQAFWVAIILSISAQIRGQPSMVVSPPSVAATNGDQNITINCTIQNYNGGDIAWGYKPLWSPNVYVMIYNTFNNSLFDATNYSVDVYDYQWQGYQYRSVDLTIKSAKPGQAATYTCMQGATLLVGHSSFIVLDPLQCPAQDLNEYAEGTTVSISCSVTFYQRDILSGSPPDINIFKGGILLQGITTVAPNTRTVTVNQTLRKEDDNVEFMCLVSFPNDSPDYRDNCSIVYYVKHEVSEITFYPPSTSSNLSSIPVGSQITCATNGRPPPIITWYNDGGSLIGEGSNLTVTEAMMSWAQPVAVICSANNTINSGLNYTAVSANYTFLVVGATPPVVQSGTEAWKIALAVIIPVLAITAIALAIFFGVRHHKKKKAKKAKKSTNGSTIYNATSATATATTATTTAYSPVATSDPTYASSNRPPPSSTAIPLTSSALGPPGFDGRQDTVRQSPGFGDLGVQPYGGSTHAVNAYPTRNSSVSGSNQGIGGAGLSMNPYPGYQGAARASNPALNASTSRPMYPYKGSNPHLDVSLSLNPNQSGAPPGVGHGRDSSLSGSSAAGGRSVASGYNAQAMHGYPNDLSSMPGSEV